MAGRADTTHAAQSKQPQPPALLQQEEQQTDAEAAAPQQFDRACTLAESCCELLQLLQMDVSPTCSAVDADGSMELPSAPTAAPAQHAAAARRAAGAAPAGGMPPAGFRVAAGTSRARVGAAPSSKIPVLRAPAGAAAAKSAAPRARPRVGAPAAPPLKAKQLQQRPVLMQQQPAVPCVPQSYVHQAPPLGLTRRQPGPTTRQQQQHQQHSSAVLHRQEPQQRPPAPAKAQQQQGAQQKGYQQAQQAISLRHLVPGQHQQQQQLPQDHHSAAGAEDGQVPMQHSTQQQLLPVQQVDAVLLPQLSTALPPLRHQQQQAQHNTLEQVRQHAEPIDCLQEGPSPAAAAAAACQFGLPVVHQLLQEAQQAADPQAKLQAELESCSMPQHSKSALQAKPPAHQQQTRQTLPVASNDAPAAGRQGVCLQDVQQQDTAVLRRDVQRVPAAAAAAAGDPAVLGQDVQQMPADAAAGAGDPAVLGPALLQDKLRAMQQQLLEMQARMQQLQLQQQAQVQPAAVPPPAAPLQEQQQQSHLVPGIAGQASGESGPGFLQTRHQQDTADQQQQGQQLPQESIPSQHGASAAKLASSAEVAQQPTGVLPIMQQSQEQQQQQGPSLVVLQENAACTELQVYKPQEHASSAPSAGFQQQQQAVPTRVFGAAIQPQQPPQQPPQQQPTPTQRVQTSLPPQQQQHQALQPQPTQLFGAALQPQPPQQPPQQQYNSYRKLLEGTAALVANSHAVNLHLQARGIGGASSPLRSSYSPNRVQHGLGRAPRAALCAGSSPAVLKQLQPSRLSVSQSLAGVSPGPTPRQSFGAAAGTAPAAAGPLQGLQADPAAPAVGGAGVRARLFGPALGAVAAALHGSQSPAQPAAAASPAECYTEAGAGTPSRQWGMGPGCMLQGGQVLPFAATSNPLFSGITASGPQGGFPAHAAGVGMQQLQQQQQWWSLPGSPVGSPSTRQLLCSSRVAQVLYGSSPNVSRSMPTGSLQQQQAGDRADAAGAGSSSSSSCRKPAAEQGGLVAGGIGDGSARVLSEARGQLQQRQEPAAAAAGARRFTDAVDSAGSGQLGCDSDTDMDSDCEDSRGGKNGVQQGGAHGNPEGQLGVGARRRQQQQQATPPGSYQQQQEAGECWTVHTNWAAADLDSETAAVAAAAAAAAGLSAQLGRGQPVRMQEHSSPFLQAGASGERHAVDVAGCSPRWVSSAAARQQPQNQQEQYEQQQGQVPPVCSPMCLMVPKKLWGSPDSH